MDPAHTRIAIQGFGNVGRHAAAKLAALGFKVIALSDSQHSVRNERGIDVSSAIEQKAETGQLAGLADSETLASEAVLETDCDILILAALEATIDCDNADKIGAKVIVEAANIPITHHADALLRERGVMIVPDILANVGGVLCSYYEWVQNLQQSPWSRDTVMTRMQQRLSSAYGMVRDRAEVLKADLRTAAYELAIGRIARAVELRGF